MRFSLPRPTLVLLLVFGMAYLGHSFTFEGLCVLQPTEDGKNMFKQGSVRFFFNVSTLSVWMETDIQGNFIDGNEYAISVYEFGDLSDKVHGLSTGGILAFTNKEPPHGCPGEGNPWAGALGNWQARGGFIRQTKITNLQLLSQYSIIGRSVVLRERADDCTGEDGNAGKRIAQCVIGVANSDQNLATTDIWDNAVCNLQPTPLCPECWGTVWFDGLSRISAMVHGLPRGSSHALTIHHYGDLSSTDSVGHHFDHFARSHDLPPNKPRHQGDLGNIDTYDSNGVAWYDYTTNNLESVIFGRSIVIHENQDHGAGPHCGLEDGNLGSALMECVIGVINPNTTKRSSPVEIKNDWKVGPCPHSSSSNENGDLVAAVAVGWILTGLLLAMVLGLTVYVVFLRRRLHGPTGTTTSTSQPDYTQIL